MSAPKAHSSRSSPGTGSCVSTSCISMRLCWSLAAPLPRSPQGLGRPWRIGFQETNEFNERKGCVSVEADGTLCWQGRAGQASGVIFCARPRAKPRSRLRVRDWASGRAALNVCALGLLMCHSVGCHIWASMHQGEGCEMLLELGCCWAVQPLPKAALRRTGTTLLGLASDLNIRTNQHSTPGEALGGDPVHGRDVSVTALYSESYTMRMLPSHQTSVSPPPP